MKLDNREQRIWRAVHERYAAGEPVVPLRSLCDVVYLEMSGIHGIARSLIHKGALTETRLNKAGANNGLIPVFDVAVGSDGTVYRKRKIWEDDQCLASSSSPSSSSPHWPSCRAPSAIS